MLSLASEGPVYVALIYAVEFFNASCETELVYNELGNRFRAC